MPSPTDNPPLAVLGLTTARQIVVHIDTAVNGLLPILLQQPHDIESPRPDFSVIYLGEIVEHAVRIVETVETSDQTEKAKEAQECAKIWAMVACTVIVVIAVIIAALSMGASIFTFGNASLFGMAVAGVVLPLNAAGCMMVRFLKVAARSGHPLAGDLATIISEVMTAFHRFVNASLTEGLTARDKALKEIVQALEKLEQSTLAINKIEGTFEGDLEPLFQSCKTLSLVLTRLSESLWFPRSVPPTEVQSVVRGLEKLRLAIAKAQPTTF